MYARALCITLLAMITPALSSPIDPELSAVIASNLNLGCQYGCAGASSAHQLNTNAALGTATNPLAVFGGLVLASGVLATV